MSVRVLVADDQALVRGAVAALLDLESDLEVVAEVGRGDQVLEACRQHGVDVAVLDVEMPGIDGIEAAALLKRRLRQPAPYIRQGRFESRLSARTTPAR